MSPCIYTLHIFLHSLSKIDQIIKIFPIYHFNLIRLLCRLRILWIKSLSATCRHSASFSSTLPYAYFRIKAKMFKIKKGNTTCIVPQNFMYFMYGISTKLLNWNFAFWRVRKHTTPNVKRCEVKEIYFAYPLPFSSSHKFFVCVRSKKKFMR